jgi:hypothetical protein
MTQRFLMAISGVAIFLSGCGDAPTSIGLNDITGTNFGYAASAECPCVGSELATLSSSSKKLLDVKYSITTSSATSSPVTSYNEVVLGGDPAVDLPVDCTKGVRIDPASTPTEAQKQCTRVSAFRIVDTKKHVEKSSVIASVSNLSGRRMPMVGDEQNLAYCASACTNNDFTNCFAMGSGFSQVTQTVKDLYSSAVLNNYESIPNSTAMSSFGLKETDIPVLCKRTDTTVINNIAYNQSVTPGLGNWSCSISSQISKSLGIAALPSTPAFEVRVPQYFESEVYSGLEFENITATAPSKYVVDVLKAKDINRGLVINFSSELATLSDGSKVPVFGGAVRSMFELNNLLILETDKGCVSLQK